MTILDAADFGQMFDPDSGLGVAYTWSFDASSVNLIVDIDDTDSDDFETSIQGYEIRADVLTSAITGIAQGQTFTNGSTVYKVIEVGPDNDGFTRLGLRVNG